MGTVSPPPAISQCSRALGIPAGPRGPCRASGGNGDWSQPSGQTALPHAQEKALNSNFLIGSALVGKFVKTNAAWIRSALEALRLLPTLGVFSLCWAGLHRRLAAMGEPLVNEWLQWYVRALPPALAASAADGHTQMFVGWWCGEVHPGTASGNEAGEALHGPWQTRLSELGGRGGVGHVLGVMARLYSDEWGASYAWDSAAPLSLRPGGDDPALLNGAALGRAGRLTAVELHRAAADSVCIIHTANPRR